MNDPLDYQAGRAQAEQRARVRRRRLKWIALAGVPLAACAALVWTIYDWASDSDDHESHMAMTLTVFNQTSVQLTNAGFDSEGDGWPEDQIGPVAPGQTRRAKRDVPWHETPISLGVVTTAGTATGQIDYNKMFPGRGMVNCTMVVLPGHVQLRCSTPTRSVTADVPLLAPNPNLR